MVAYFWVSKILGSYNPLGKYNINDDNLSGRYILKLKYTIYLKICIL